MNSSNVTIFASEMIGTFGLLVAAAGSIIYDGKLNFALGHNFVVMMHFFGLSILVFAFGRYSMAHFNPAITIGFICSGILRKEKIFLYLVAQTIGAISGTLFIKYVIGNYAKLGMNIPSSEFSLPVVFGVEVIATMFLMGGILFVVGVRKAPLWIVSLTVGGIVALDVFFFGSISGASMNPIRSSGPAIFTGIVDDLWIYWLAPVIGSVIISILYRIKFHK
jgi:aquaporin Z